MPILNLNDSVISLLDLDNGLSKEKFKGPIGVIQSIANPVELLISLAVSNDVS